MKKLIDDDREIREIMYEDKELHSVGIEGCTKIIPYTEKGLYNEINYIAVYYDNKLKHRIPAWMIQITYK